MSEAYKQKEYELRSAIDNISSIPYVFENYVEETEYFIDRLLDDTKEINTLRKKLQQKENIIKEVRDKKEELMYLASKCSIIYRNNIEVVAIYDRLKELFEILDKGKSNEEDK